MQNSTNEAVFKNYDEHEKYMHEQMSNAHIRSTRPYGTTAKAIQRNLSDVTNILCVSQLTVGRTHGKSALIGRIVRKGIYTGGSYFVLEDLVGDVVKVGVYNDECNSPATARKMYPVGRSILVTDPYFKVGMDGSPFIRVDDPRCLQNFDFPNDADTWHQLGNKLFQQNQKSHGDSTEPTSAAAIRTCWTTAIKESQSSTIAILLSNRAAAFMAEGKHGQAARDCAAAVFLDPDYTKAFFRLATALQEMDAPNAAFQICSLAIRQCPTNQQLTALKSAITSKYPELYSASSAGGSASVLQPLWWEDTTIVTHLMDDQNLQTTDADSVLAAGGWETYKAKGNESFGSGNYEEARQYYTRALSVMDAVRRVERLECNLSMLCCNDGDAASGVQHALVALVLNPHNAKAWYRRAQSLKLSMRYDDSQECCKRGLAVVGDGVEKEKNVQRDLQLLHRHLQQQHTKHKSNQMKNNSTLPNAKLSTEAQLRERAKVVPVADSDSKSDSACVQMLNMMASLMSDEHQMELYGYIVQPLPDFRYELYNKHSCWPPGVRAAYAEQYLNTSYQHGKSLPHTMEMTLTSMGLDSIPPDWILKRLHSVPMEWWMDSRAYGDIYEFSTSQYIPFIRHSFSNQAYRKELLTRGRTHVAIGFVDLGVLLTCELTKSGLGAPVKFVGFDCSAYAVAKTLVVWAICERSKGRDVNVAVLVQAVVQVWFSTVWSESTNIIFVESCRELSYNRCIIEREDQDVICLLRYWSESAGVSLMSAVKQWNDFSTDSRSSIPHLKRESDRIDMSRYELTGAFGVDKDFKQVTGSICMFDCPDGTPPLAKDETVFSTIAIQHLFHEANPNQSIVEVLECIIFERVKRLVCWARNGEVEVNLICKRVEDAVDEISEFAPWTMSWSNVLDYVSPSEFHRLARRCSRNGDTIHFGYSMNWISRVFGGSFLDMQGTPESRKKIIRLANDSFDSIYGVMNCKDLLRLPPPTNPMNTTSLLLESGVYQKWIDWLAMQARKEGYCSIANCEHAMPNVFASTGSSTIYFTWTYDQDVAIKTI